jgi:Trk K+ transport system NAD-binding subunit
MEQHIILCGLGRIGWRVLEYVRASGAPVVVVDTRCAPDDPRLHGVTLIQGDCRQQDVLERAGVARARGVLILTSDDLVSISTALMVRHLNHSVRVVVRMFNQGLIARLGTAVQNVAALSASALTAPLLALIARTGHALGTFRLETGETREVVELTARPGSALVGKSLAELTARREAQVLAHGPANSTLRFLHDVDLEARLARGDRLVVCGEPGRLAPLLAQTEDETLPELLWAGFVRRLGRVVWRTLAEVDLAVKICTSVLVSVIVISTIVFHLSLEKDTIPDALYRTISLMATGADMDRARDLEPGGWQKVFVSILRLVGAALTAAFTAIVTNYLLRARLGGALEIRRIPDSGHLVVCGLGNIGFRVVQQLQSQDERVVVIERSRDNAFIPTARRLGVAVIVGDATVPEVLRQAHSAQAKAVVAATSNELINLEIALLVRDLNPHQRVVLRLTDPKLAQTLREAANVRLAFSIPDLAAPAFLAALLGDRVRGVFQVAGRLLAVVDVVVSPDDTFLRGQSVRALAIDYQLQPVYLVDSDQTVRQQPLNVRLGTGDRLTAILALPDLQRLLHREKAPCEYAVEVTACPLPTRPWVAQLLRTVQETTPEAAQQAVEKLPLCLGTNLTRGQAEDLWVLLTREKVSAQVRRLDGKAAPSHLAS